MNTREMEAVIHANPSSGEYKGTQSKYSEDTMLHVEAV